MTPRPLLLAVCLLVAAGGRTLRAQDEASVAEAVAGLASGSVAERVRAAERLGRCGRHPACARGVQALQRSLFDSAHAVRRASVTALVRLDARAAAGAIARLLEVERHPQVQAACLLALGTLRADGALPRVVPFASHPDAAVRAAAVAAAGDLGGPQARRLVLNSLQLAGEEDASWLVRATALLALARCGRPEDLRVARRAYREGGGEASWLARSAWARVTAALDPRPQAELERLMRDADARVAVTAAAGLARAGRADLVVGHLRAAEPGVRAAAVGAVAQARLAQAYPALRLVARWDASRAVRWAAVLALFEVDDPAGDELMVDALGATEPAVWMEALVRLERRTGASHGRDAALWRAALARHRRGTTSARAGDRD